MVVKYFLFIEEGVKTSMGLFRNFVKVTLGDSRSWNKQFVEANTASSADVAIIIAKDTTVDRYCAGVPCIKECGLSCYSPREKKIYLKESRWLKGSKESQMTLNNYRTYMINHEMGHHLGYDHDSTITRGYVSVMHQQTRGIPKGARPNPWVRTYKGKKKFGWLVNGGSGNGVASGCTIM